MASALLRPFHPKFVAQAEISSPSTNDRFDRLDVTPLEALGTRKSEVDNGTKVLSALRAGEAGASQPNNGKQLGNETLSGLGNEAPIGFKTASNYHNPTIPDKKYRNISEGNQRRPTANAMFENTFPDARGERAKRSPGTTYAENVDTSVSGEAQPRERFVQTVQGVSNPRAEYRRGAEEARGASPRQSEPHLDTSTFALSGDSAHNQAMVHWSGHNSSVSFSFTKTPHHTIKVFREGVISPRNVFLCVKCIF